MSQRVRLGIVGCSHACRDLHRPTISDHPQYWEVRALYDLKPEPAQSEAEAFGPPAEAMPSLDALLARDDLDLVLVLTKPPTTHHDVVMQVVAAGKHVLVEKPLAQTAAQCDEMIRAADEAGVILCVHQNRRWDENYQEIVRAIDSGKVGQAQLIRITQGCGFDKCSVWDWGVHLVDQACQLGGGRLVSLRGWTRFPQEDVDHHGYAVMSMRFERRPDVEVAWLPQPPGGMVPVYPRFYVAGDTGFHVRPAGEMFPDQDAFYEALYTFLRRGGPLPVDPRGARNAIYALELMAESARQGRELPADDWLDQQ